MKDPPPELRPREKLLSHGPAGAAGCRAAGDPAAHRARRATALQMAQQPLDRFQGLGGLLRADGTALATGQGPGAGQARRAAGGAGAGAAHAGGRDGAPVFDSPQAVRDFLRLELAELGHEVFAVLFPNAQHRLIRFEPMFRGTLTQTSVYPREVLKRALALDAPRSSWRTTTLPAWPSRRRRRVPTQSLKTALQMIDVRVLDHFPSSGAGPVVSFAERGVL